MKHYLDRHGREVRWEGKVRWTGDHDYLCAHHPRTPLVEAASDGAPPLRRLRRYGGKGYYCPRCDAEPPPAEPTEPEDGGLM